MSDVFEKLLPCKWRDVDFPVSSVQLSFEQDLVEHKYVGVDGANVEGTGRGPMKVTMKIPFVNGIAPGKGEKWDAGDQYPSNFRLFLFDFADRSKGTLVHPELGEIECRPHTIEFEHDPMRRDGVIVTATWLETTEDVDGAINLANNLPQIGAVSAGIDLDASDEDLSALFADYLPPKFEESFESFANKITGAIDKVSTTVTLAANKPAQMLNRVKQVEGAIDRAKTAFTWPITDACERMKSSMFDLTKAISSNTSRPVARYTVPAKTTLAGVGQATGASADELIKLNPQLASNPEVIAGTVVRHYKK